MRKITTSTEFNKLTAENFNSVYEQYIEYANAKLAKEGLTLNDRPYYKVNDLFTSTSTKVVKGLKYGFTTYVMYLSPFRLNSKGINLCSNATEGCAKACLFSSGRGSFDNTVFGRVNRSEFYLHDKQLFMDRMVKEITSFVRIHGSMVEGEITYTPKGEIKRTKDFAIRLNGTADIDWDKVKIVSQGNKTIFEVFPNVQFYDYTKNVARIDRLTNADGSFKYPNYHLTFSHSEMNSDAIDHVMNKGVNVASVFFPQMPSNFKGYNVYDGDDSDLTFLYPNNHIVGLYLKVPKKTNEEIKKFIKSSIESGFVNLVLDNKVVEVTDENLERAYIEYKEIMKAKRKASKIEKEKLKLQVV